MIFLMCHSNAQRQKIYILRVQQKRCREFTNFCLYVLRTIQEPMLFSAMKLKGFAVVQLKKTIGTSFTMIFICWSSLSLEKNSSCSSFAHVLLSFWPSIFPSKDRHDSPGKELEMLHRLYDVNGAGPKGRLPTDSNGLSNDARQTLVLKSNFGAFQKSTGGEICEMGKHGKGISKWCHILPADYMRTSKDIRLKGRLAYGLSIFVIQDHIRMIQLSSTIRPSSLVDHPPFFPAFLLKWPADSPQQGLFNYRDFCNRILEAGGRRTTHRKCRNVESRKSWSTTVIFKGFQRDLWQSVDRYSIQL